MSVAVAEPALVVKPPQHLSSSHALHAGRKRRAEPVTNRVRRDGKFFRLGDEKFYVKGVTYGPFAPNRNGDLFPDGWQARKDFELIRKLGANCVRIYHVPPPWFMDLAHDFGLKIFLDVAWPESSSGSAPKSST